MRTGFGAARLRARSDARGHWWLLAALALVLGVVAGLLLASTAAARRTASSYERLERATAAPDLILGYGGCDTDGGDDLARCAAEADRTLPLVAGIEGVRALSRFDAYSGVFAHEGGRVVQAECDTGSGELSVLAPRGRSTGGGVLRPDVVEGRAPNPRRAEEVTANLAAAGMGIHVGQRIEAGLGEFCPEGDTPARKSIDLLVVGIVTDTVGLEAEVGVSLRALHATPALADWARAHRLDRSPYAAVRLAEGRSADVVERSDLPLVVAMTGTDQESSARRGVQPDVVVLLLIAALGLLGFGLVLAPLLVRIEHGLLRDADALRALGCTRSDLAKIGALHGAGLAALSLPIAVVIALAASSFTPVGDAGSFEPSPGPQADLFVLGIGSALLVALVLALGAISAVVAGRRPGHPRRRPSIVGAAGRAGVSPAGLLGLRLAFEGTGGRRVSITGRVVAQVVAVVVLVGSLTFSAGLTHLDRSPRLLGWNWDAMGFGGDELDAALRDDPDLERVTAGTFWAANYEVIRLGPGRLATWMMSFREGPSEIGPTIIDGRRPERPAEIALHPKLLERLGIGIGDDLTIVADERSVAGDGSASVAVVGTTILPLDPDQLEAASAMTYDGLRELLTTLRVPEVAELRPEIVLADFAPGVDGHAKNDELQAGDVIDDALVVVDENAPHPAPLTGVRLDGVATVPKALGLMAAVLALFVMAFLVIDRIGDWRAELAMHRVLGFSRSQLRRSVAIGSAALGTVVAAIGIPVGVAAGRVAWLSYADRLGVKPEAVVPVGQLALVAGGVIAIAIVAALVPGWRASRRSPARLLRAG